MPDEDRRAELRNGIERLKGLADPDAWDEACEVAADLLDRLEGEREPVAWMEECEAPDCGMVNLTTDDPGDVRSCWGCNAATTVTPLYRPRTDQADPPPQEET